MITLEQIEFRKKHFGTQLRCGSGWHHFLSHLLTVLHPGRDEARYQQTLQAVSNEFCSALEIGTLIRILADVSTGAFGIRHMDLYLSSDHTNELAHTATTRHHEALPDSLKITDPLVAQAVMNDDVFEITPAVLSAELLPWRDRWQVVVAFPLQAADHLVGLLLFTAKTNGRVFTERELHLLSLLSKQAALALDRAQKYEDLQRFTMRLEQLVHERTHELEAANVALRQADKAKDEFLTVLSHELLTPLTSIIGWAETALDADHADVHLRALEVIFQNAQRQKRLVNDLLDVSRVIYNRLSLRREVIDLWQIAELAVETCCQCIEKTQIRLVVTPPAHPMLVLGDSGRLQQVFMNLLANAAKFTPPDGVITLTGRVENGYAVITMSDTGKGIPADALERIFAPFMQVLHDDGNGGLGLGLALVKGIVEAHAGQVAAESEGVGKGARFTIKLPLRIVQD